jgi:hypothetical protein
MWFSFVLSLFFRAFVIAVAVQAENTGGLPGEGP